MAGLVFKVELGRVVGLDDHVHGLLRRFHRSLGRKEAQFSHCRVEQNDFRRVLNRRLQQSIRERLGR